MPNIIGLREDGKNLENVEVKKDTYKTFNWASVSWVSSKASFLYFADEIFENLRSKNLPLNNETIKEYLKEYLNNL